MHIDVVFINVHKYEAVVFYHIFPTNSTCIVRSMQRDPVRHYHNRRVANVTHGTRLFGIPSANTESRPTLSCLSEMLTPLHTLKRKFTRLTHRHEWSEEKRPKQRPVAEKAELDINGTSTVMVLRLF